MTVLVFFFKVSVENLKAISTNIFIKVHTVSVNIAQKKQLKHFWRLVLLNIPESQLESDNSSLKVKQMYLLNQNINPNILFWICF